MIFMITPLVQEARTRRRWLVTLGIFAGAMLAVLGVFGAAMAWAGAAVAAKVTTPHAREVIASLALTVIGLLAIALALGELGLTRPLLPRATAAPGTARSGSLTRRALVIALGFGATMAIFSPLSAYALVIGWVAAQQSAWLGAVTLMAYGAGLLVPLALAGTLATRGSGDAGSATLDTLQERVRVVGGVSLALAGGFLLSMWTPRATWALFLPSP
jgi:cytochrome c biogenesis protein CcdA